MKFHHLGIATSNIQKSFNFLKDSFGVEFASEIIHDKRQDAYLQLVQTKDITFELITGKRVENLISKNITYYHVCYEVNDIDSSLAALTCLQVSPPTEAILFDKRKVAFALTPLGLIELLEAE